MGLRPTPHKGLCPLTLQGELVPLDPHFFYKEGVFMEQEQNIHI